MRLATRRNGTRDGELMLVSPDLTRWIAVPTIAQTLQHALDDWARTSPQLDARYRELTATQWRDAEPYEAASALAPLPRAYQWADASVYRNHARLIYQWRREPIPPRYEDEPLVYQGGSDVMLPPTAPIEARDEAHDIDFEAEVAVITTDVPMGVTVEAARDCIALVVLLNDVSLRGLIPSELSRGFGFYQSKPASSFAPVAVTRGVLGNAWKGEMLHLPVHVTLNGNRFGCPNAGEDTVFHFGEVIAHLATTRSLSAGTIVGAGTVSNADPETGSACITEARVRQILDGQPESDLQPYLRDGDRVTIEVLDGAGTSVFGRIEQSVCVRKDLDAR
ncbi:2-keto-4-pentenoate hydratase [Pandoraea cepalis]|uniref:2-keto-4-pentenoate hydratase n=1 Tax=Pandoraea cepalis TaxID=2508294 RepID=A0AAW7MHM0_9BURK|nr:2-keto-4-pentenoate hydratase [Pandoraea cepalis]MDN4576864.1 2-keto-4-pentenoate hydratase [Pandoraea cepalis]